MKVQDIIEVGDTNMYISKYLSKSKDLFSIRDEMNVYRLDGLILYDSFAEIVQAFVNSPTCNSEEIQDLMFSPFYKDFIQVSKEFNTKEELKDLYPEHLI
jgi:hypothetical protein